MGLEWSDLKSDLNLQVDRPHNPLGRISNATKPISRRSRPGRSRSQNENRKNVPGSVDAVLIDRFLAKLASLKLDKNEAMDEAFSLWLGSRA